MKVMFLIDSLGSGGAERSTAVMLPLLRELGVEASVVTLYRADHGNEELVRSDGFDVTVLGRQSFFGRVRELRSLLHEHQPDILHTVLFAADQVGRLASVGSPVKVVTSLVNAPLRDRISDSWGPSPWKLRVVDTIDKVTGRLFVDRFHSISEGVAADYLRGHGLRRDRVEIVERGRSRSDLGIPSEARREATRRALSIAPTGQVILAAGRMDYQKAHEDLIRAFGSLARTRDRVQLLIAGRPGDASSAVERAIDEVPWAASRIRLLGFRDDIADLLVASDVMAFPSRFEGTGGVLLEAFALSTPVVTTNLSGLQGIARHEENCLVVPVGDTAALAGAIGRLLDDRGFAATMARGALEDFESRFRIESVTERMLGLYRRALQGVGEEQP